MGKITNAYIPDVLHIELCSAISDLAKSVDVAVKRIALRSKCSTAIADAEKTESFAEALRTAATEEAEQATLVPNVLMAAHSVQHDPQVNIAAGSCEIIDELHAACSWFATGSNAARGRRYEENAIAKRILELHDRLGGLLKF